MKRDETKRNETKRNETKQNETKRNETKRNELKVAKESKRAREITYYFLSEKNQLMEVEIKMIE